MISGKTIDWSGLRAVIHASQGNLMLIKDFLDRTPNSKEIAIAYGRNLFLCDHTGPETLVHLRLLVACVDYKLELVPPDCIVRWKNKPYSEGMVARVNMATDFDWRDPITGRSSAFFFAFDLFQAIVPILLSRHEAIEGKIMEEFRQREAGLNLTDDEREDLERIIKILTKT